MSRLLQHILLARMELRQSPCPSRYDIFKRLVYEFDPNIYKIAPSWTDFSRYCTIMDGNVIYMFPGHDDSAYLHIMYQYTDDCQTSMIKVQYILDKTTHKQKLCVVHNELYRKCHKQTMDLVCEDLLYNYWNYDNVGLWKHELTMVTTNTMIMG